MKKLKRILGHCLTVLIAIQAVICLWLLFCTATGREVSVFGYRFYYIVTQSMEPTISAGAQIAVKEVDPAVLEAGDIITFYSRDPAISGYPNTHRIVEITEDADGKTCFATKGDHNASIDAYYVYPEDVIGEVTIITPKLAGVIQFYSFAGTPMGFMIVVVMPLMMVFGTFLNSFIQEIREMKQEETEGVGGADPQGQAGDESTRLYTVEEVTALVNFVVSYYMKEHAGEEITPERAQIIAEELLENLKS